VTHIDPFAPADSPLHPANVGRDIIAPRGMEQAVTVDDQAADLYQWRRDHFVPASEAGQDVAPEELEDRHVRYGYLLEEYGAPDEQEDGADFVAQPLLLRRSVWTDLEDTEIDEWKRLFELHATDDERDPAWVDRPLPTLDELQARDRAHQAAAQAAEDSSVSKPEPPAAPKATALKEEWVQYALAVEAHWGNNLTDAERDHVAGMTVAALKAAYKPKDA
jgi:hypothetical protein